jgi:alpha,alpha-trehalose-phosphate synthase [UDP-forming]
VTRTSPASQDESSTAAPSRISPLNRETWRLPFDPVLPPRRRREEGRLVVASNRLPVVLKSGDESRRWCVEPAAGGLVTALEPVMRRRGGVWVGWSGAPDVGQKELDRAMAPHRRRRNYRLAAVDVAPGLHRRFYEGFSNRVLWPVFHGFALDGEADPRDWESYWEVNRRFARVLAGTVLPTDHIWVHDYHLMLVASELRALGVDNPVSFFLHIPFPRIALLERIPWYRDIVKGLLDHDLVGFQMPRDESNFVDAAGQVAGHLLRECGWELPPGTAAKPGRRGPATGSFPISIDAWEFQEHAAAPDVSARAAHLLEELGGRKLILGVDRLDYTKGIPEKLRGFARALETFPGLRGKVVLRQLVVPSRDRVPAYARKKAEIERLVQEINEEWGRDGWTPVDYRYRRWTREELLAHYRVADAALVTPLNDGMNLVAKEYAVVNQGNGVLILSAFAGAAAQLGHSALLVNPSDPDGVAHAVCDALSMPQGERGARMSSARRTVCNRDVHRWVADFLEAADSATPGGPRVQSG